MLTRCAKAYSSSCSQFILGRCAAAKDRKINKKNPYFGSLGSSKVINVDTTEKLITTACCDS